MSRRLIVALLVVCAGAGAPAAARAQAKTDRATLVVTVADQSGAVIPNAKVTVANQDGVAPKAVLPVDLPVLTSSSGTATFDGLAPGRYSVQAEFPGFETIVVRDVRVKAGDNKRDVTLPIRKVAEDVTVGRDKQSSALDPQGMSFSTVLTREQIAALPDDPDEMEKILRAMAPPGAQFRVDGFTGGKLPPKSQIRSIRLPRMDMLAAQNHGGMNGMLFIDIMTQPGNGPIRGSLDVTFRDDALNARNPFTPEKGDEGLHQGGFALNGSIVPNKSSFSISTQRASQFDSGNILAAVPGGTVAEAIRRPIDRSNFTARFDQAISKDHMARSSYMRTASTSRNLGVGAYDLPERAYTTTVNDNIWRMTENGPLGRRFFSESRLQLHWLDNASRSFLEAPTIRVLDAFTTGGAQQAGGRRSLDFEAASDLDYVRGAHSMRTGILVEGGNYRSDDAINYFGTFTFASLADYEAGRPSAYTRRVGDPLVQYSNLQLGAYIQDDFRLSRSLMLSFGVRYEAQTLIPDQLNISPRASVTWAPGKNAKTTFRAGFGRFTDWLGTGTYEQTLRVDGVRQRELNVPDPSFPDPGTSGVTPPANRYQLDQSLILPESQMVNAGVDRTFGQGVRMSATYTHRGGSKLLRGHNLNAPVHGVRPDPSLANIVDVVGDAASKSDTLNVSTTMMLLNWHQTLFAANYSLTSAETNTTGAFALPANGDDLSTEWGMSAPRHRLGGQFNTQPIRNLSVGINVRAQSGSPYTITTGTDDNGDGVFADRPVSVARNSARTASQWDIGLRVAYSFGFGPRVQQTAGGPQAVMISLGGGGMQGGFSGGANDRRFRLELYGTAQNVTDRRNYIGYSGVLLSPFYGRPTNVLNPRKIEIGARFGF